MAIYYFDPSKIGGANNGLDANNAWINLQTAADTCVAGDTCYCTGTQTLSAIIDFDLNSGNGGSWIKFISINNDCIIDANNVLSRALNITRNNILFKGFTFTNGITYSVYGTGVSIVFDECVASNSDYGIFGFTDIRVIRSKMINNSIDGILNTSEFTYSNSILSGNTRYGASLLTDIKGLITGCIVTDNTNDGLNFATMGGSSAVVNSVIDGNGANGIRYANTYTSGPAFVSSCRITNNAGTGLLTGLSGTVLQENNFITGNVTAQINVNEDLSGKNTLTIGVEGYANRALKNYNLIDSATNRRIETDIDGTNKYYTSSGLSPADMAGGGGGTRSTTATILGVKRGIR